jgi:K+ transporter
MYSINVFLTFALSNLGMSRRWILGRKKEKGWWRKLAVHLLGLIVCSGILVVTIFEKFREGGWVTVVITGAAVFVCARVHAHYRMVAKRVKKLNENLLPVIQAMPDRKKADIPEMDPELPTAVLLAGGFSGLGLHTLLQIQRLFPSQFRQVMFISVGVIDSGSFKGADEIEALRTSTEAQLLKYVGFARIKLGWAADSDMIIGTEAVAEIERLCREIALRFPRSMFFAGNLIFREPSWWHRLLHNETAHSVQRRLEFDQLPMVIVPVRVLGDEKPVRNPE